jgi:hypothetical protein
MRLPFTSWLARDDRSSDPDRWSRAKLESEIERLEDWVRVMEPGSTERGALQKVLLKLYCVSARRRSSARFLVDA